MLLREAAAMAIVNAQVSLLFFGFYEETERAKPPPPTRLPHSHPNHFEPMK
jgi:hypothetical protein